MKNHTRFPDFDRDSLDEMQAAAARLGDGSLVRFCASTKTLVRARVEAGVIVRCVAATPCAPSEAERHVGDEPQRSSTVVDRTPAVPTADSLASLATELLGELAKLAQAQQVAMPEMIGAMAQALQDSWQVISADAESRESASSRH
jgi:hypothetical protein